MVNPQNPANLLVDFREKWLGQAKIAHPDEYEESEKALDTLIQTIINYWSGAEPFFLLEPILNILLENQYQFDNQGLEVIREDVVNFLKNDQSFKDEVEKHFEALGTSPKSQYSDHPILRHFLDEPPRPPLPIKLIFIVVIVVLGLGSVGLWMVLRQLPSIFSLCESDFKYYKSISCGNDQLSNFSKLSNQERKNFLRNLQTDFEKKRNPSTLIAYNNAKILQDIQSRSLQVEDVYPIAVAIPLSDAEGAAEAGQHILSGIAKKQDELNNSLGDKKLFIIIADDENKENKAKEISKNLSENLKILGVIAPYSSSNLADVLPIYTDKQVPLISPTVTAAMKDIKDDKSLKGFFKKQEGKKTFFFKTSEDTDASIRISLDYLKKEGYKQLIIFADDEDLYSLSLLQRLREQSKNQFSIVEYKNSDFISLRRNAGTTITKITQDLIGKYGAQKDETAILYLKGAYKDEQDTASSKGKLIRVLEVNQGAFLVVGSNTVRRKELFEDVENNPKILNQLVVPQPWFPLKDSKEVEQYQDFWKSEDIINWNYVMGYDATQVLLYAIAHRANKSQYPAREEIPDVLNSNSIQNKNCADKDKVGITDGILTTNITFNGSDRCSNNKSDYVLIKPVEIKLGTWQWQVAYKDVKQ
jgi:ABC-type branched-subunit amino acid transport system substrate-binding protein